MNKKIYKIFIVSCALLLFFGPNLVLGNTKSDVQKDINGWKTYIANLPAQPNKLLEKQNTLLKKVQKWFAVGIIGKANSVNWDLYNEFYFEARTYENLARQELTMAQVFLDKGMLKEANEHLELVSWHSRKWNLYDQATNEVWLGNLEKAQQIEYEAGKTVNNTVGLLGKTVNKIAEKTGNPTIAVAGKGLEVEASVLNFALDWGFQNLPTASKNAIKDKAIDIFADAVAEKYLEIPASVGIGSYTVSTARFGAGINRIQNEIQTPTNASQETLVFIKKELANDSRLSKATVVKAQEQLNKISITTIKVSEDNDSSLTTSAPLQQKMTPTANITSDALNTLSSRSSFGMPSPVGDKLTGPWNVPDSHCAPYDLVAVSQSDANVIYITSSFSENNCGVYKSNDGGETFSAANGSRNFKLRGFPDGKYYLPITAISIASNNSDLIYVGTSVADNGSIFKSIDGGKNWTNISGARALGLFARKISGQIDSIAIDPKDSNIVYIATSKNVAQVGKIYKTLNGGVDWSEIKSGVVNDHFFIVIDSRNTNIIYTYSQNFTMGELEIWDKGGIPYASISSKLYKSTNQGNTWKPLIIQDPPIIKDLAIDPFNSNIIYISTGSMEATFILPLPSGNNGVMKTTSGGEKWFPFNTQFLTTTIVADSVMPDVVYTATVNPFKIFYSVGGSEWLQLETQNNVQLPSSLGTFKLYINGPKRVLYTPTSDGIYVIKLDQVRNKVTPPPPQDISANLEITITSLAPSTAIVNTPYFSEPITAVGGTPPYKWSLYENSSHLPPGLSINKNGVIEGTPTQSGTYNFIVEAKDSSGGWIRGLFGAGEKTTKIFTLVVNEAPKQDPPIVSAPEEKKQPETERQPTPISIEPLPPNGSPPPSQNNRIEMSFNNENITLMKGDTAEQIISVIMPSWNTDTLNFTVKDTLPVIRDGYIRNVGYDFIPKSCKISCETKLKISTNSLDIPVGSFRVTIGTSGGTNITSSFELKIIERIPPSAPTMRATAISASQIKLDWSDNAAQDDALYIERKIESNNDYKYIHSELKRNLSSYVDSELTSNTRYCYRIYFTNTYVSSPNYSQEQCATTLQDAPAIPQGKPDLTITSLRAPTTASVGNGTPMLQDVSFTIANNGPVSAGSFRVAFYWSSDQIITVEDTLVKSFFYHGLGPRESKSNIDLNIRDFTIPIPASFSPNTYYLGAIIDDQDGIIDDRGYYQTVFTGYGRVQESNETNNARKADTGPIELKGPPVPPTPTSPPDGFSYIYTRYDYKQPALGKQIFEWQKSNPNDVVDGTIFNGAQCEGNAITTIVINAPWDSGYITKDILLAGKTYSWNIIARANGVASISSVCRSFSVQADALPLAPSHLSAVAKPIYDSLYPLTKAPFVVLTWQDNSQNELVFTVARNENGGSWSDVFQLARLGKDTSSIIDEYSVSAGKNYCYKVKARGTSGPSDYSEPACVTIP